MSSLTGPPGITRTTRQEMMSILIWCRLRHSVADSRWTMATAHRLLRAFRGSCFSCECTPHQTTVYHVVIKYKPGKGLRLDSGKKLYRHGWVCYGFYFNTFVCVHSCSVTPPKKQTLARQGYSFHWLAYIAYLAVTLFISPTYLYWQILIGRGV